MEGVELFKSRYRMTTTRWRGWDYGAPAWYFITICTKDRIHYFGSIDNGEMTINSVGKFALDCWQEIPKHFPFVELDKFVVMPNHVHGIIHIKDANGGREFVNRAKVETQDFASLRSTNREWKQNYFGPQSKNLPSVIRGYKIGVTKYARNAKQLFFWQLRYHDHIIRDEFELNRIRLYIQQNPQKWHEDRFFTQV